MMRMPMAEYRLWNGIPINPTSAAAIKRYKSIIMHYISFIMHDENIHSGTSHNGYSETMGK